MILFSDVFLSLLFIFMKYGGDSESARKTRDESLTGVTTGADGGW